MSIQALFELSKSTLSPKYVGLSPFFSDDHAAARAQSAPPLRRAVWEYMRCSRRAINTRIIGFSDPTLQECVADLVLATRATRWGGADPEAAEAVRRRRGGVVDPASLPWAPTEGYTQWLRRQGRLVEDSAGREGEE